LTEQEGTLIPEAHLEPVASGLAPVTPGWFVVNTADAAWMNNDRTGGVCIFESDDYVLRGRPDLTEYMKPEAGFTIRVFPPGETGMQYHAESVQEDFLVLAGECVLIVEDEERHLKAWDFVHCPPMTAHGFVAKGDGPCVIVATGNRRDDLERVYPRSEVARRNGAEVVLRPGAGPDGEPEREPYGSWSVARPTAWDELPWAQAT